MNEPSDATGSFIRVPTDSLFIALAGIRERVNGAYAVAQQTSFGWVLGWVIMTHQQRQFAKTNTSFHLRFSEISEHRLLEEINSNIKRFWEAEAIPEKIRLRKEDQLSEDIFVSTHQRDESGRYIVRLPFRPGAPKLGYSRKIALRQFLRLEEKGRKDPSVAKFLKEFFQDCFKRTLLDISFET